MIDWNGNGKADPEDMAFTAMILDEMSGDTGGSGGGNRGNGCCGTTAAMFLIGILLPVVVTAVFIAH